MATIKEQINSTKDSLIKIEKFISSQKLSLNTNYEEIIKIIKDMKIEIQKSPINKIIYKYLFKERESKKKLILTELIYLETKITESKTIIRKFYTLHKKNESLEFKEFLPILQDYMNKNTEHQKYQDELKQKLTESLNGGYYEKYLKYKQKYLKLKQGFN